MLLGVAGNQLANVDISREVGNRIIQSMIGVSLHDFMFRQKEQVILMTATQRRWTHEKCRPISNVSAFDNSTWVIEFKQEGCFSL